jgi:Bacterial protein of unknown function (HtrL_YibB)
MLKRKTIRETKHPATDVFSKSLWKKRHVSTQHVLFLMFPLIPIILVVLWSGKEHADPSYDSLVHPPGSLSTEKLSTMPKTENLRQFDPNSQSQTTNSIKLDLIHQDELITSTSTVVTAYFTLKSKFAKEEYIKWMSNMLSLQDAMVIFTSHEMIDTMQSLRTHAANRTVIIPFDLNQLELVQKYDTKFWEHQLDIDPEKRIHRSYELFWIWLSKSFFVNQAIQLNPYQSEIFMWSDIGCYRNSRYRSKQMIVQIPLIPEDRILQMAHHEPRPPPYIWWNDKYTQKPLFYHSGSQMIGYKDTWIRFHGEYLKTVEGFVQRDMFLGEDQTVLQSTCLRVISLCAYVPFSQVSDNHYFGLRYVLHFGGKFDYWYPPEGLPVERSDVTDKSLLEPMKPPPPMGRAKFLAA